MRTTTWLCAALLVTGFVTVASATDATGCRVYTTSATKVGDYYLRPTWQEIWEETNGLPGLQMNASGCSGGRIIPSDTCFVLGPEGLISCTIAYATAQI